MMTNLQGGHGELPQADGQAALTGTLYQNLRQLAQGQMRKGASADLLQPTALVHEAWVRLARRPEWRDRQHFLAIAAKAMRNVLVDHARAKHSLKRGGGRRQEESEQTEPAECLPGQDFGAIHASLEKLERLDPELVRIVELRFFAGQTVEETARVLSVSKRTVDRGWATARAWLRAELAEGLD